MGHIKLKNKTGLDIPLYDLDVVDAVIPASSTVSISSTNETIAIVQDIQLQGLIATNKVVILLDDNELTKLQSIAFTSLLIAQIASLNISNGGIYTGHVFADKNEKYKYFEGSAFTSSSISLSSASAIISATGYVKTSGGLQEIIGFDDGTNTAQIYLDTATSTIKSRAAGNFVDQEFKIKIVYITT